jgi:hypothetical protein
MALLSLTPNNHIAQKRPHAWPFSSDVVAVATATTSLRWTRLSRALLLVVLFMVVGVVAWPGDGSEGNDDCHSEIRGSGPQDSVRS